MTLRTLGQFRLEGPLHVAMAAHRMMLACHVDDPQGSPPSFLVKLLPPGHGEEHLLRKAQFAHEIQLLRAFNHNSIPSIVDYGEVDDVQYFVSEYIDGVNLAELLAHDTDTAQSLSRDVAVYLAAQLADALHYVHTLAYTDAQGREIELQCLHRDLCPANILLSRDGDVMLTDFGAAVSCWLEPCNRAAQAGHTAYKAPERISGSGETTVQSDLFAYAVILWEMLRGERCFRAENDLRTMDAIVRFDISHPSRRISGLSPKLNEIIRRNLDRDPTRRYQSAYQVLQRLAQTPEAAQAEGARDQLSALVRSAAQARAKIPGAAVDPSGCVSARLTRDA